MKEEKTLTTESGATRCGQSELADGQSCGRLVLSPVRAGVPVPATFISSTARR